MTIFETVLGMSASASVAIGIVLILRLVLRKMPRGFIWVLWLAVLARLWIPAFPQVQMPVQVPQADPAAVVEQMRPEAERPAPAEQQPAQMETPVEETTDPMEILSIVWMVGAASMTIWGLASDLRLRRKLRTAVRREDGVYLADGIDTPFVTGLLFPRIYLPSDLDGAGERYILLHERRHIHSGDPIVKLLFFGALCIHWFNPLVWLACLLAERDMELRCDEGVFRDLEHEERMDYAAALVACAARRRSLMPLAFGEGDTKRRVKNVLTYKKPKWWAIVLAAVLCITAAGCMLVDPKPEYDPEKLEYPGLRWGMSPEDALDALGKTRADIVEESEDHNEDVANADYWDYGIALHDVEAFGQETTIVLLSFRDYTETGESFGLTHLRFCYPDGYDGTEMADVAALAAELERLYGPAGEAKYWDRETDTTSDGTPELPANTFEWGSLTSWSCLSGEEQDACKRMFHNGTDRPMTWEEYVEQLDAYPAFSILLQPVYSYVIEVRMGHPLTEEQRSLGMTDLCITLDARLYYDMKDDAQFWLEEE